ncbi:hypothetical protein [Paenibacillus sp. 1-18]|uniref:hypothetical protein n=1 Tax=Paenibacillus sp. 1-18 TaxID=1333846 RepID=UPI0004B04DEC|nr:hypothetical protein [Paenibacillus sp. 1-18]
MEEESSSRIMSDDEFMKLVKLAQTKSDVEAMNTIFQYFDQDIKRLSKLLRMPKEDAIQSMKTQPLELIMKKNKKPFIEKLFLELYRKQLI